MASSSMIWVIGFSLLLLSAFRFGAAQPSAATLVSDEVVALREIAKRLGKREWDFSVDPCSGQSGWTTPGAPYTQQNTVACDCSFANKYNTTSCHVTRILLKSQGLQGVLPPELVKLPYLQEIDLTFNYLSGTIPPGWGSMRLEIISIFGNRVSGSIPKELGSMTTLRELILEANRMSGVLPPELGNLINLERLVISSNNFTGQFPERLSALTNLKDFRINDNKFSGKILGIIGNWTKLMRLEMQASGFEGPIPSEISLLANLTNLRISDINGPEASFPPLNEMKSLKTLILRSCNLAGELPPYIGGMTNLFTLDLSFNKLTGQINSSFNRLSEVDYVILTANLLDGPVPKQMLDNGRYIDLSYNKNFTIDSSIIPDCQERGINLFRSSISRNNSNGVLSCLQSSQCPQKKLYELHINCGGKESEFNGSKYEADEDVGGPAKYLPVNNWAFSSTGSFTDNDNPKDTFIVTNISALLMNNALLYTTARISPVSLTYVVYCLLTGSYTVSLHFAEIMFTSDSNYTGLARRVFDIYIQEKLVLKDFNIVDEAGGAGKAVVKKFLTVDVTYDTLEIRLYWAGRGTTRIPSPGIYGPLISAISVVPNFKPPSEGGKKISAGTVAGIVVSIAGLIFFVLGFLWWRGYLGHKNTMDQDMTGLDLHTGFFTLRQIKAATNNFDAANKIGEGGFGPVYKGLLSDGTMIAVKQLSSKSKQGSREFVNEIGIISALQHPHLVKLYGCCVEGNQLLLIYEYMENNSLAHALFGPEECQLKLDWQTRHKICVGIAKGLAYLHEESRLKIVHRDIKATNVLLDKDLHPKISDFGLAKLDPEEKTHLSTRVAGTYGYMAPEYAMRGRLTDKADVYSFGVVALEIVSGRSNTSFLGKEECDYLHDWVLILKEKGNLMDLVDPRLGPEFNNEEVMTMINVALLCTNASASLRPTMSTVVRMLEGQTTVQEFVLDTSISSHDLNSDAVRDHYQQSEDESVSETDMYSLLIGEPQTSKSSTAPYHLFPTRPGSVYLNDRME
ncbi:PREDICTED: probable leucine-rich repeat receptor-like serine/threonine-protein kinase At3g14840 isoform X2 [Nelumbo nucifera]|uniref:non-specific serine/threonine protein kinase n=1 Tax=Nelumbo nucifera TaxID=4432 RepID=A0A1U8B2N7_NELNU|nr:PREDICTED: probable leucine-rich repeat receptor-like serine/threonine-protein kinase At3g14840 isoform X2 [Nelumbo nucifera]